MSRLWIIFLSLIFLLCVPHQVQAQDDLQNVSKGLSSEQLQALEQNQQDHLTIDRLWNKRVLSQEQVEQAHKAIDREVAAVVGRPLTRQEISQVLAEANKSLFTGIFTFVNIIRVFAALLLIIALGWLCRHYLEELPAEVYEVLIWGATIGALLSGKLWPQTGMWLVMPGAFALVGALVLTFTLHCNKEGNGFLQVASLICSAVWGTSTVAYASPVLGFMTVLAIEAFLGFSVLVLPLCYCIGFKDKDSIPRAMCASFIIMALYIGMHINGTPAGILTNFSTGGLFMGAFVYYLGCLIISSKYYLRTSETENGGHYLALQLLTVVSGLAALYIGSAFHLQTILGIGGTFFFLYVLEKYFEIPWKNVGWAWSLLGLALGLYGFAMFAMGHPQYFLFTGH